MEYTHSLLQTLEAEKKCVQIYVSLLDAKTTGGIHSMKSSLTSHALKPNFRAFTSTELTDLDAKLLSIGRAIDSHRATIKDYFQPR